MVDAIPRANILGVTISAINLAQTMESVEGWIIRGEHNYICVTPAHGVMDCQRDPELKRIFNHSGLTTPDGMSIVWLLKWKGYRHVERVYGPDLLLALCERSLETGWRHFFYGGAPGVAERLSARLVARFPRLQVAGAYAPPFRPITEDEDRAITNSINAADPDIVWVGLSTPKQERWMAGHIGRLNVPVLVGVGAAFDFLSGSKPHAPRWIQRFGFEWLFRLVTEPRRLWRRYIQYPYFLWLVLGQILGLKHYPVD
jgi:N-acetylglucosaminyldiphosphoundecaprenol N-acetyl-beta-D-mannosaminyltransferase